MPDEAIAIHRIGRPGGRGPLAVLVHGMEDTWRSWSDFADELPPSWRIFALDLPWRTGNAYTWRRSGTAGQWLQRSLAELGRPVDVLIGHSMGANAVMELLCRPGEAPPSMAALLAPFYWNRAEPISWQLFDHARHSFDAIIAEGIRLRLGHRLADLDDDIRDTMLEKMLDRIGPLGFLSWFDHFAASAALPLAGVAVPTLILASGKDPCLADGRAEALAGHMPAATLLLDDSYDHFCHLQQAVDVAAHTVRFARTRRISVRRAGSTKRSAA